MGAFPAMALLVGRFVNKVDRKGRVSVPKLFRSSFECQTFAGLYAYPSFDEPAIEACDAAYMEKMMDSLGALENYDGRPQERAGAILDNAHTLSFDPEGRIVLPADLLAYAGISDQALFVGRGRRIEIWEPANHSARAQKAFEKVSGRGAPPPSTGSPDGEGG